MSLQFHDLSVAAVTRETPDSVCVAFDVPEDLRGLFRYRPGQHLTLRATIGGEDVRRSYSICSGLGEGRLRVGVKKVDGGLFSAFVNDRLNAGDIIQVMPPQGRFAVDVTESADHNYLMIAAGSGITPVLSIIRSTLEGEPGSEVTLVYGNRETGSIMFREELEDLKDRFLDRFRTVHILSRETQDVPLFNGRIDAARLEKLARAGLIQPGTADGIYICGPGELIDEAAQALETLGADKARIHFERFTTDGRIRAWANRVHSIDLTGDLTFYSGALGAEITTPMAACVAHFFNHQTHHRGQVHAMLTRAGLPAPVTDIPFMPEEAK